MAAPAITSYEEQPAIPVYVDTSGGGAGFPVVIVGMERCNAGAPVGVTVSTAAVQILAANTSSKQRIITNNGSSNIFLGRDNTVTTTGATMGIKLVPGGTYTDSGIDLDQGAIWGIGDAVSASQNVSAWEKT